MLTHYLNPSSNQHTGVSTTRGAHPSSNIPSRAENELIERLDGLRELFEFDIDEAQLLSAMNGVKIKKKPYLSVNI